MHPLLTIGIRAARIAGDFIIQSLDDVANLEVTDKSMHDYVSVVDKKSEQLIINTILKSYPDHAILAEESGEQGSGEYQWIIDPLDGTTNFLHGFPQFAVSIAVKHKEKIVHAVIYDPFKQELFTASKGAGSQLNGRKIRVSNRKNLNGALLGTGFPFGESDKLEDFINIFRAIFPKTAGIRRAGAASLDLAYVACGRLDGFWEFGLKEWDMAAGALLLQESGAIVTSINNDDSYLKTGNILTANSKLHEELFKLIRSENNVN